MRVAIYCRLSREDDDKLHENDESESIQNQKSMLINYAIERSWDIYNIYCDEGYSGIDSERPEFNKLLEDAKNHKFDIVLCKTNNCPYAIKRTKNPLSKSSERYFFLSLFPLENDI